MTLPLFWPWGLLGIELPHKKLIISEEILCQKKERVRSLLGVGEELAL